MSAEIGEKRRRLMRELADEIMEVVQRNAQALGAAKGRQLSAAGGEEERRLATLEVRHVGEVIRQEIRQLITGRVGPQLARLSIDPAALLAVIDAGVDDYERNGFAQWQPPGDLLERLPADVAAFLSPENARLEAAEPASDQTA